jgi:hypothetical protein
MASTCRSCGVAIVWAVMLTGKRAPFVEDAKGEWSIVDGRAVRGGDGARYTSHFANCPQASQWRGAR